ncbi:sulfite exporter TauE/SafE family protein [Oenococcus sicerae]|uniref:Probable membrane transporter protein n=1 Tax=Oenococcus sicerae TaxID=2203724 RepID=A0AAJ1R962_9LACO|nr:sulfite exporter TauE/SafE family protein [Oenococcus sicerae]MDN6900062.1 sulfite exporter TauE/SafE family protein [Oenococcus sicerae]QAS69671.1 sulfite exporter TauE/SafE family protein [Oenococcus sicerae]
MSLTLLAIYILIGVLAGVFGAILGLGGGVIVTPILVLAFNLPIHYAIAASIIAVIGTSSGASVAYLRDDLLNIRVAMFLEIFTTIGALIGAVLVGVFKASWLNAFFGLLLLYQGYTMWQKMHNKKSDQLASNDDALAKKLNLDSTYYDKLEQKTVSYHIQRVPFGALIMFGAGFASGLLGIGSGSFKVFAMDTVMKMPLKPSSATSNFMMGVTAAASALIYFFNGTLQPLIVAPIAVGIIFGSTLGSRIMPHLPNKVLRSIFIPVVMIAGIQLVIKAFGINLY